MIFEPFDVVRLPFPYADRATVAVRPGVVLTASEFGSASGTALIAMVTSARSSSWPFDVAISNLDEAGLKVPCLVRMKLNTIDLRLIERKIGHLSVADVDAVRSALNGLLPLNK